MSAPTKPARWTDPDAEPSLLEVVAERAGVAHLTQDQLLHRICDALGVREGGLSRRLGLLLDLALQREAEEKAARQAHTSGTLPECSADVLDSLTSCELNARQLCEDTGRPHRSVATALERLRWARLVTRERRGGVWVYRATALGVRALRGGR